MTLLWKFQILPVEQPATCGHVRPLAATCPSGHLRPLEWLQVAAIVAANDASDAALEISNPTGHVRPRAATCGHLRPLEATRVAASGCFFEFQIPRVLRPQCQLFKPASCIMHVLPISVTSYIWSFFTHAATPNAP